MRSRGQQRKSTATSALSYHCALALLCTQLLCHSGQQLIHARAHQKSKKSNIADCVVDGTVVNDAGANTLMAGGNKFFSAAHYDSAEACYLRALAKDPNNPTATLNIGLVNLMAKDYTAAQRMIEAALDISPDYAYAHLSLGNLHMMRVPPHYRESEAAYMKAYSLAPKLDNAGSSLGEAQLRLAQELISLQHVNEAQEVLRRLERGSAPTIAQRAQAGELLSDMLRQVGDLTGAKKASEAALQADPRNVRAMLSKAITYRTMGHLDMALHLLQQVCPLFSSSLTAVWAYF